jgi:biotin synthase
VTTPSFPLIDDDPTPAMAPLQDPAATEPWSERAWGEALARATQAALQDRPIDLQLATTWLAPKSSAELAALMAAAAKVRHAYTGDRIELCAIVNARSGKCSENCAFCAQSARHQTDAPVYDLLSQDELLLRARRAAQGGVSRFGLVTSGKRCPEGAALDTLCRAIEAMRRERIISPCASLGLLRPAQAQKLADAGLVRYHHNLEAGPRFFPEICTSHSYAERVETVQVAKAAGLEVCVGGIVGLGENASARLELATEIRALAPASLPLNFLNPIQGTPLSHRVPLSVTEALAAVAVFKLVVPSAVLRTCGGRQQILGAFSPAMYLAGAAATMTGDYLTTTGPTTDADVAGIAALGLALDTGEQLRKKN